MMIMRFRYLRSSYVSIDQWVGVADTTCLCCNGCSLICVFNVKMDYISKYVPECVKQIPIYMVRQN